jgi:hypothetical protein
MPSLTGDALLSAQGLGLDYAVGAAQGAFKSITELTKKYNVFERRNKDLADSFNLSVLRAAELGDKLDKLAKDFDLGGDAMRQLTIDLKGLIGPFATLNDLATTDFGKKLIKSSALLRNNYGLSADSANKLIRATQKQGKNLEIEIGKRIKITDHIEAALGGIELTSETLDDVANLTSDLQVQYGKMPGMLELSVIKAKQLGISMQQLHTTGKNLLNIETSIGQEMEYQLLSGRRLVDNNGESLTNQYRMAVMQKNSSKQASIMFELLQKEGKTLNDNFLAREKMAELLGMDEATLSTMLQKYEAIQDLPGAEKLFGLTGDALLSELKDLTTDAATIAAAATSGDQRSTETILESLEDKLTTGGIRAILDTTGQTGASIAAGQRNTRINAGNAGLTGIGASIPGAYAGSALGVMGAVGTDAASILAIAGTALGNVLAGGKTISKTNPLPVAIVGTTGTPSMNDFASFGGGNRMLLGPEGAFSINNNDLVLGGTSLFGNKNSGSGDIMQFAAAVVAAINNQTRELKSDPVFGQGLSNSYYG